jgi:hypothetical protein
MAGKGLGRLWNVVGISNRAIVRLSMHARNIEI